MVAYLIYVMQHKSTTLVVYYHSQKYISPRCQHVPLFVHQAVSYEEFFSRIIWVGGPKKIFREKKRFLRELFSETFARQKFAQEKKKYGEILNHYIIELKSV